MKGLLFRRTILMLIMLLISFVAECTIIGIIYRKFYVDFFMLEFMTYFLFLFPILLFRSEKTVVIYSTIYFIILMLLMMANLILDYSSNDIFSIRYLIFFNTMTQVFSFNFINWGYLFILLGFIAFYVIFMVFVYRKIPYSRVNIAKVQAIGAIVTTIVLTLFFIIRDYSVYYYKEKNNLVPLSTLSPYQEASFMSANLKNTALENLGMFNFYLFEIDSLNVYNNVTIDDADDDVDTVFTRSLKDMNVVEIMIETGVTQGISETLTPNLYALTYGNGLNMDRCYSKNKTNISEFIGISGSTTSTLSGNGYDNPYTLPKKLKDAGYYTTYFHDNVSSFYSREEIIKKAGFENAVFCEDEWEGDFISGTYPFDYDFIKENIDLFIPNKDKFYTYWTTLSTHGPYNQSEENLEYFKTTLYGNTNKTYYELMLEAERNGTWGNPLYGYTGVDSEYVIDQMRDYECKLMNFDLALGLIIDKLKETNKFDNTLIVLYGDHDLYYESNGCDSLKNYIYGVGEKVENGISTHNKYYSLQYNTIMSFYNPKLIELYKENVNEELKYDYFTSPYCIVPTVLDLLGIEYHNRHYIGKSIFDCDDDFDNLFYTHELKFIFNDKASTYDINNLDYSDCDDEYKKKFIEKARMLIIRIAKFNEMYGQNQFGD